MTLSTAEPLALAVNTPRLEFWGSLFKICFSLGLVLGLIFLLKKYMLPKVSSLSPTERIKVLSKSYLDPQTAAYLIGFHEKRWIVLANRAHIKVIDQYAEEPVKGTSETLS